MNVLTYLKDNFSNTKLKTIVNVYQMNYKNGYEQGFGDYIRGSIGLIYICNILNLNFDIDIKNHPMINFIDTTNHINYNVDYNEVLSYTDKNYNNDEYFKSLIDGFNNCENEVFFLFCNININISKLPEIDTIIQKTRQIILPKLIPNIQMNDNINRRLNNCNFTKNNYTVIHLRCGDSSMVQNKDKFNLSMKHINDIIKYLQKFINNNKKYIVIGDNDSIKKIIKTKYPNIIYINTPIIHLGESKNFNLQDVMFTLLDFYTLCFSEYNISFSAYAHGSGFSKYSSFLYNVPYKSIILQPTF